ncbi:MAG TPA: TRAP transporter substrate-binding protein [Xanthobacteraceae bacterium]|nr:TRAP transporter substrate-binding protein [Xanthobacteraceae bacterium]
MKLRATALGALLAFGLAGTALAQDKPVHLKMGHWVPPAHPLQKAMEEWGASVQKASNGTITFQVYPAQQLGKAPDHYDMARDGIADVTYINPGYQPGRFPIIAAGELPFLMKNGIGGSVALDKWYRKYAANEMKDVKFCLAFVHDPGALHAKKKIETPDQIKGMKIRPAHATMASFVTLLGGTNVQASAPESREVLERGVADAITFPWGSILLFKIDSVTKFHMDVPLYNTTFAWVMNKAKYDAMSPAQKKVIDDHCSPEWAAKVATPWANYEAAGRDKLRNAAGHTVYKISDAQVAQWQKAAEPLSKIWADNIKKANAGDPDAMLKALKDELKAADAAF